MTWKSLDAWARQAFEPSTAATANSRIAHEPVIGEQVAHGPAKSWPRYRFRVGKLCAILEITASYFVMFDRPVNYNFVVFASPGEGRSFFEGAASREALDRRMQEELQAERVELARNRAVKQAYWAATPTDHADIGVLGDALIEAGLSENPTHAQVEAFFNCLPMELFSQALSWGFSDTVVRDDVFEFLGTEREQVMRALSTVPANGG